MVQFDTIEKHQAQEFLRQRNAVVTARALGTDSDSFPGSLPDPDYPVGVIAGVMASGFSRDFILGDDDGLVPVESTKIAGMADFIIVESGHSFMRYSDEVARQTVAFLLHGTFLHEK